MSYFIRYFFILSLISVFFASCTNYKRLINDEVVLKDGNTETGTIIKSDSVTIRLKKIDESQKNISWSNIDSVSGKKFRTIWMGFNIGIYNVPYFSVFQNKAFSNNGNGIQGKIGLCYRGSKMYYFNLMHAGTTPYPVNKFGLGFQRYVFGNYLSKQHNFFVGSEVNAMSIKYNNGLQFSFEPFSGYEIKITNHIRIHAKLGLQFNLFNKNNQTGANFTIGIHFLKKNFKKYYSILNKEHRIYRR